MTEFVGSCSIVTQEEERREADHWRVEGTNSTNPVIRTDQNGSKAPILADDVDEQ
jgi:hypothetical protein